MISLFRRHLQGRFLKYVIYAVSFFVVFPSALMIIFKWVDGDAWAIKVNGKSVGIEEYQHKIFNTQQQIQQFKNMFGDNAQQFLKIQGLDADPQKIALDSLIDQKLLEAVADKLHIKLSPQFVAQQLIRMVPPQLVGADGSVDLYSLARAQNMSVSELQDQITNQLTSTLLMQLTEGAVYVPEFVIKEKFIQAYTPRSFLVAELSLQNLVQEEEKQKVSDAELKKFFDAENRKSKRYIVPEKRAGFVWQFDGADYPAKISDKQIESYYKTNKLKEFVDQPAQIQVRHILMKFDDKNKAEVRAKLAKIKQEVDENPKLFADRAKEFSDDAESNKKGGLTDFFSRGKYAAAFEQAAFRLTKNDEISQVVETDVGFELIQRAGKKPQVFKDLSKVRDDIVEKLRIRQFTKLFQHDIRRALAQEEALKTLEKLAQQKKGKKETLALQEKGVAPYMKRFFMARKGSGGSFLQNSEGYAFYVSEIKKSYQPKFADLKEQVAGDYYRYQAEKKMKKILHEADVLTDKKAFEAFADKNNASLESTGIISQQMHDKAQRLMNRIGGSPSELFSSTVPGSVVTFLGEGKGFMLCLDTIAPFDEKEFKVQKDGLLKQLYQEQRQIAQSAFIASLYKNATIKVDKKIVR
jgi:parvulin-like peptidyl-prolyl isomerase